MSSTWPPLSVVWSRRSRKSSVEPAESALATWRCEASQPNHSGNSVKTSISTVGRSQVEELRVDLDAPRGHVDLADRVSDERHEQRIAARRAAHLEHLARRQPEQP